MFLRCQGTQHLYVIVVVTATAAATAAGEPLAQRRGAQERQVLLRLLRRGHRVEVPRQEAAAQAEAAARGLKRRQSEVGRLACVCALCALKRDVTVRVTCAIACVFAQA